MSVVVTSIGGCAIATVRSLLRETGTILHGHLSPERLRRLGSWGGTESSQLGRRSRKSGIGSAGMLRLRSPIEQRPSWPPVRTGQEHRPHGVRQPSRRRCWRCRHSHNPTAWPQPRNKRRPRHEPTPNWPGSAVMWMSGADVTHL